jgi:polysaccharide biosynthesis protein PslH
MRVLFLAHDMLWPTIGGGRIRGARLLHRALDVAQVELVIVAPGPDAARDAHACPELPGLRTHVFADEEPDGCPPLDSLPVRRSPAATALIRQVAARQGIDVVHVEGHHVLPLVPGELLSRTVLVEQNIESELLRQRAALGEPIAAGDITRLRESEERAWRQAAAVITLTPEDAAEVSSRVPGTVPHVIPNGWDHLPAGTRTRASEPGTVCAPRLLFLADFEYFPNKDAFRWLVGEIFPAIRDRLPGACLVLAGVNLGPELAGLAAGRPGVRIRGPVDDVGGELDKADFVLCPLRVGGGVKVKVIEALRRGCLLVSTSIGVQGIPEPIRSGLAVADRADDFADLVVRMCGDHAERCRRRRHLAALRHTTPTWEMSARQTMCLWSRVAGDERAAAARG